MHQTKKGNQWYFGMKAHIGVDADSGLVHTVRGTAANVGDVVEANSLLHGQEVDGYADAGYQGVDKRPDMPAPTPERKLRWHVAMKRSKRKVLNLQQPIPALQEQLEIGLCLKFVIPLHQPACVAGLFWNGWPTLDWNGR